MTIIFQNEKIYPFPRASVTHPYLFIMATSLQQPQDKSQMTSITKTVLPDITHHHQLLLAIQRKSAFATVFYLTIIFFQNYYYSSDFIGLYGHMLNFKPFEEMLLHFKR